MPFPVGNVSQVIFRSTPTLYKAQGNYATANQMARNVFGVEK